MHMRYLIAGSVGLLVACSGPELTSSVSGSAALQVSAPPIGTSLPVAARAEPGGRLIVTLTNPAVPLERSDTLAWTGEDTLHAAFENLPVGDGYRLTALYRDARGIGTHADASAVFSLARAGAQTVRLQLRAVLGKIQLQLPVIPESVDSLGLRAVAPALDRSASTVRLAGGKAWLQLDSLPLGVPLTIAVRAWNTARDTLYFLDTSLTLDSATDAVYAWNFATALARAGTSITFADGGEAMLTMGFGTGLTQTGRLIFSGFSDSGKSDWIRLYNPAADTFRGKVHLWRGSTDSILALEVAPQTDLVVNGGVASFVWSTSGGIVWKLADSTGTVLYDLVYTTPGKNGWPAFSTSHRTASLRISRRDVLLNDAGSSWCMAADSPVANCSD